MIPMSVAQIMWVSGAAPSGEMIDGMVTGVSTDSREVKPGELFVAIKGDRFDGHDYVGQAIARGAVACLVSTEYRPESDWPLLCVDSVVESLGLLAAHHRRISDACVIGITGSVGKTTTKAMIAHVLSKSHSIAVAPKSFNNQIGVPLTLLSANREDRFVVVEIGTSQPGEVKLLSKMTSPDVGVVTSVGAAHLAGLGSVGAVRREKLSLFDHVKRGGRAFVNAHVVDGMGILPRSGEISWQTFGDHPDADLGVTDIFSDLERTTALVDGEHSLELSVAGHHNAVNACGVFGVCLACGISPENILSALTTFAMPPMRLTVRKCEKWTVIDDCYNSNPISMAASLNVLSSETVGRRVFVAGTMAELGDAAPDYHRQLGEQADALGVDVLIAVGEHASDVAGGAHGCRAGMRVYEFVGVEDVCDQMSALLHDGDTILVKGSRCAGLEKLVSHLLESDRHAVAGVS